MNKKIKVGIFIDMFYPMIDGVVVGINSICPLLNDGADVTVFTSAPVGGQVDDSVFSYKIVRCRSVKTPFVKIDYDMSVPERDKSFQAQLEASDLDLVHIRSPFAVGKAGLKYAKKHGIPCVITLHSQYKQDFFLHSRSMLITKLLMRHIMRLFNAADECWCVNAATKEILYSYGIKHEPVVMENGTDMLPVPDKAAAARGIDAQYGITPSQKVFMYTGRLVALKNIFFIAEALKTIAQTYPDFKMFFIGEGADADRLKEKVEELGLKDNVVFTGLIVDRRTLATYYARADLFLFPSFYDTDGVVKKEAASQGTPVICVEGSTVAKTVVKDRNAYIGPNDPAAFGRSVVEALSNPEKHAAIAECARRELYIRWQDTAQRTLLRYHALIETHTGAKLDRPKKKFVKAKKYIEPKKLPNVNE